jgi:conjugal transfer pilus assembly protein TraV
MKPALFCMLPLVLMSTGCASLMTGLDGQGSFSCKAPDGISCASLSGVYANAVQNNLPGQRLPGNATKSGEGIAASAGLMSSRLASGDPLRSAAKVRRVWLAPWEDDDEVLHDQAYFYMVVDAGRWQIEHSRRQATDRYRPVTAPRVNAAQPSEGSERPALPMERTGPGLPSSSATPLTQQLPRVAGGTTGVLE